MLTNSSPYIIEIIKSASKVKIFKKVYILLAGLMTWALFPILIRLVISTFIAMFVGSWSVLMNETLNHLPVIKDIARFFFL